MNKLYGFTNKHPLVLALYFISVFVFSMFTNNPITLTLALIGGVLFCAFLESAKAFFKSLLLFIPLFLLIAFTNPLFSHNGKTILFFLNNNPITLESIFYGINLGVQITAVIYWFKCFNNIFTTEKILYLFSVLSPKISTLLSSSLRFISLLKEQSQKINDTQKAMGLYTSNSLWDKFKGRIRVFSALTTWSLENAIETGASMKARGYGSAKRTSFAIYKFKRQDIVLIVLVLIEDIFLAVCLANNYLSFEFYPMVTPLEFNTINVIAIISFALLCFLPFITELKERLLWKYLKSKI